ncbi:MAG: hypothetical protein KDC95_04980 [Planctomycetes bacterium]|nr:hypothetical protein [Planctomycetota bacterium]
MKPLIRAFFVASIGSALAVGIAAISKVEPRESVALDMGQADEDCGCDNPADPRDVRDSQPQDPVVSRDIRPDANAMAEPRASESKREESRRVTAASNSHSLDRLYQMTIRGRATCESFFHNTHLNPQLLEIDNAARQQFDSVLATAMQRFSELNSQSNQRIAESITKHIAQNQLVPARKVDTSDEAKRAVVEVARKQLADLEQRGALDKPSRANRVKTLRERIANPAKFVGGFGKMHVGTIYHMDGDGNIFEVSGSFADETIGFDESVRQTLVDEFRSFVCGWFVTVAKTLSPEQARRLAMNS